MEKCKCFLCGQDARFTMEPNDEYFFSCESCGKYYLSLSAIEDHKEFLQKNGAKLSRFVKKKYMESKKAVHICNYNFDWIVGSL
ncbi:MAG: hypothetical protein IJJ99_03270 [Oscillospiraceae bacterium]|nr:hypothetical protein [Oscillospiraceae bacterium]